jgi:SH3 domain-containing protein
LDQSTKTILYDSLISGNAQLDCRLACVSTWVRVLPQLNILHHKAEWKQLAFETLRIGFETDLSWYYLGRAAEGLEATDAAKVYYQKSIAAYTNKRRCSTCNGLTFPEDSALRISQLKSSPVPTQGTKYLPVYSLRVRVEPADAVIKIMNITPKFKQGIRLTSGTYHLKIAKRGFNTINKTVKVIDKDVTVSVHMKTASADTSYIRDFDANPKIKNNPDTMPTATSSKKTIQLADGPTIRIKENGELRLQPSPFSEVKTMLKKGDKVTIIEESGDWIKVDTKHGTGYIYVELVR